ncbi:hypothetical protein F4778DRAFT_581132 [Xylariomycetidae sp. FL2044]|nr:hypothetical protein F4778DRAFT_581132 [Xylariomycetidae sp. FL2044]
MSHVPRKPPPYGEERPRYDSFRAGFHDRSRDRDRDHDRDRDRRDRSRDRGRDQGKDRPPLPRRDSRDARSPGGRDHFDMPKQPSQDPRREHLDSRKNLHVDTKSIPTGPSSMASGSSPASARHPSHSRPSASAMTPVSTSGLPKDKDPKVEVALELGKLIEIAQQRTLCQMRKEKAEKEDMVRQRDSARVANKVADHPAIAEYTTRLNQRSRAEREELSKKMTIIDKQYREILERCVDSVSLLVPPAPAQPVSVAKDSSMSILESKFLDFQKQVEAQQKQFADQQKQFAEQQKQTAEQQKQYQDKLQEQLQEQLKERKRSNESFNALRAGFESLKSTCTKIETDNTTLKAANASLKSQIDSLQTSLDERTAKLELETKNTTLKTDNSNIKSQLESFGAAHDDRAAKLETKVEKFQTRLEKTIADVSILNGRVDDQTARSRERESELSVLTQDCKGFNHSLSGIETKVNTVDEKMDSLDMDTYNDLLNVLPDIAKLPSAVNDLRQNVQALDEDMRSLRKSHDQRVSEMESSKPDAAGKAGSSNEFLETRIAELRTDLGALMEERVNKLVKDCGDEQIEAVGAMIEEVYADIDQLKARIQMVEHVARDKPPPEVSSLLQAKLEALTSLEQRVGQIMDPYNQRSLLVVNERVQRLEEQKLTEQFNELNNVFAFFRKTANENNSKLDKHLVENVAPLEKLKPKMDELEAKVEAVVMSINTLDSQWANLSSKEMAERVIRQLNPYGQKTEERMTSLSTQYAQLEGRCRDYEATLVSWSKDFEDMNKLVRSLHPSSEKRPASPAFGRFADDQLKRRKLDASVNGYGAPRANGNSGRLDSH